VSQYAAPASIRAGVRKIAAYRYHFGGSVIGRSMATTIDFWYRARANSRRSAARSKPFSTAICSMNARTSAREA